MREERGKRKIGTQKPKERSRGGEVRNSGWKEGEEEKEEEREEKREEEREEEGEEREKQGTA